MQRKQKPISGTDDTVDYHHITVVTVNWYSTYYIRHLFQNLKEKAAEPEAIRFLIVDNTSDDDENMNTLRNEWESLEVISPSITHHNGSVAHAHALDLALQKIRTEFTLVVDPDIHVFAANWDRNLITEIKHRNAFAAGAPYPFWKLGKYHDFPSPVFILFRTQCFLELNQSWSPFALNKLRRVYNFCARQIVRMGLFATRERVIRSKTMQSTGRYLESLLGICGPDTGWLLADASRKQELTVILFSEMTVASDIHTKHRDPKTIRDLIEQYECYEYQSNLFMVHKYGTHSFVWKTEKGQDRDFWFEL
ncbi:hypothetical protein K8T06_07840, partial [bacterium]|nr:hypothetical protein [bacterium]